MPFALPIAVLTFFGGFVPIVGAFVAGAIAILVALVSNGVWTAVAVLAIMLLVQQLEGNVMQPILVGRTLKIHRRGGARPRSPWAALCSGSSEPSSRCPPSRPSR